MRSVSANLIISIDVDCPYCEKGIDILHSEDFDYDNDLTRQTFRDDKPWGNDELHDIDGACPHCKKQFKVTDVQF